MRGAGVRDLANKAVAVFPGRVGTQNGGVIEREHLAAGVHGLCETGNGADAERNNRGIGLVVVFARKTILLTDVVVDISVYLRGIELARLPFHKGVVGLISALGLGWSSL